MGSENNKIGTFRGKWFSQMEYVPAFETKDSVFESQKCLNVSDLGNIWIFFEFVKINLKKDLTICLDVFNSKKMIFSQPWLAISIPTKNSVFESKQLQQARKTNICRIN